MRLSAPSPIARLLVLTVLAASSCVLARAQPGAAPKPGDVNSFRDWMAACDNLRSCSAYGVDADIYGGAFIRVARDGAADMPATITIGVNADGGVKLEFDDLSLPGLPHEAIAGTAGDDDAIKRLMIRDPAAVAQLITSLRKAGKLIITRIDPPGVSPSDPSITEISLTGFAAAMLWIDEQQKRVGTVTAVIGRGDKPASAIPSLPAAPVVRAAKIAGGPAAKSAPKPAPAAVLTKAKKVCDASEPLTEAEDATRLSGNQAIYWFHCKEMSGAYNYYYALIIAAPGASARLAQFASPPGPGKRGDDADFAVNPIFDEKTVTLATLDKGRGVGDCGDFSEWVWDGTAFQKLAKKAMPNCKGIPVEDWPTVFRAVRK